MRFEAAVLSSVGAVLEIAAVDAAPLADHDVLVRISSGSFVEIPSRHGHQSTANACAGDSIFLNDEIHCFLHRVL